MWSQFGTPYEQDGIGPRLGCRLTSPYRFTFPLFGVDIVTHLYVITLSSPGRSLSVGDSANDSYYGYGRDRRSLPEMKALLLVLIVVGLDLTAAGVDPTLVGSWNLQSPGAQFVWGIQADGHYLVSGSFTDFGSIEAAGGKWTTVSAATKVRQSGTYSVGPQTLSTVGPLGPARWKRGNGEPIPAGLPKLAQDALARLRRILPDAVLVMVEVKTPGRGGHPIELRFFSKSTGHIYVSGNGPMMDLGPPNTEEQPLPPDFIDLPEAVEIARKQSMKGALGDARLRVIVPPKGAPLPVWQVNPARFDGELARSIDAIGGKPLDTAHITPMEGTDAEIIAAARRIQAAIQGIAKQRGGAAATGAAGSTGLASCGVSINFVDQNSGVAIPTIRMDVAVYNMLGAYTVYVPTRRLTDTEQYRLDRYPHVLMYSLPGGVAICPECALDFMASQVLTERLEQMAQSGCK